MKIQDLKIGNLVKWDINENCVVEEILEKSAHLKGVRDGKEFIVNASIGSIEGIPIDDEFLINKANFVMPGNLYIYYGKDLITTLRLIPSNDEYFYPQILQEPELSSDDYQIIGLPRIQYIHELQNLLYTLFKIEI
jgi:hypothetical protein